MTVGAQFIGPVTGSCVEEAGTYVRACQESQSKGAMHACLGKGIPKRVPVRLCGVFAPDFFVYFAW